MLWIILILLAISVMVIFSWFNWSETVFFIASGVLVLSSVVGANVIVQGLAYYPQLVQSLNECKTLEQHVRDIKEALYTQENKNYIADMVNLKQSTALSDYLASLARAKANYNAKLAKAKLYKNSALYWWLWIGPFLPDAINEMELLK